MKNTIDVTPETLLVKIANKLSNIPVTEMTIIERKISKLLVDGGVCEFAIDVDEEIIKVKK